MKIKKKKSYQQLWGGGGRIKALSLYTTTNPSIDRNLDTVKFICLLFTKKEIEPSQKSKTTCIYNNHFSKM